MNNNIIKIKRIDEQIGYCIEDCIEMFNMNGRCSLTPYVLSLKLHPIMYNIQWNIISFDLRNNYNYYRRFDINESFLI